ncbi:MAG: tRNA (adenosine(37)-N6)-threonylcarbamoyltransferase complex dimerization subunit type 1 TsaB [Kofleriaceae bacterium]|nr:tRNA (adenosine(37)-N6)-threonylcarbamoyltransferase complex dimerization subunit type 1 TsaB [Kofleriaceae bacterium]MCB9571599.1 tRNA (adenosine(37)-N6)-threonylcarbamoyltransferase complex dimerization subunit type 1 TsaB [Kofleriaceae bacterium]
MKVLGIDTATLTESAAIVIDGAVAALSEIRTSTHSDRLLPLCAEVLAGVGLGAADLDAIAVGAGPGSFTGLRIGMATAKGLAFALGTPLWAVSSLAALADDAQVAAGTIVVPILDARRGEVYAGAFRRDGDALVALGPERVLPPADLAAMIAAVAGDGAGVALLGDGLDAHAAALATLDPAYARLVDARRTPSAAAVARLALAGDRVDHLVDGAPAYVRPSEAEVKYPGGVPGALRRP